MGSKCLKAKVTVKDDDIMGEVFSVPTRDKTTKQKTLEKRRTQLQKRVTERVEEHILNVQELSADDENETEIAKKAKEIHPNEYQYPFENLTFEGGGVKGSAYIGLIQVLDEIGILPQIKRLAGTSIGAMTAMFLAAGFNSDDLKLFLGNKMPALTKDSSFLGYIPSIVRGYGVHSGANSYKFFGERLKEKLGNPDITFKQLYKLRKIELCIVVVNVNYMVEEYCHHKTTPNMPIRLAVRMSISLPGFYQPVRYSHTGLDSDCLFTDGGVLCNSPLHVYDGWFLSSEQGDGFLDRFDNIDKPFTENDKRERFERFNEKTLGTVLYGESEFDVDKSAMENKYGKKKSQFPDTKIARAWTKEEMEKHNIKREYKVVLEANKSFFRLLKKHDLDNNTTITKAELKNVVADDEFAENDRELLFGEHKSAEEILEILDTNEDGEVDITELVEFVQTTGLFLIRRIISNHKHEIDDVFGFASNLIDTMVNNSKRIFHKERDIERLVGINTGYIDSVGGLEDEDQEFLIQCGRESCYEFLQYYAIEKDLKKKANEVEGEADTNEQTSTGADNC